MDTQSFVIKLVSLSTPWNLKKKVIKKVYNFDWRSEFSSCETE